MSAEGGGAVGRPSIGVPSPVFSSLCWEELAISRVRQVKSSSAALGGKGKKGACLEMRWEMAMDFVGVEAHAKAVRESSKRLNWTEYGVTMSVKVHPKTEGLDAVFGALLAECRSRSVKRSLIRRGYR